MADDRFRIDTGIPRKVRKAYIAQAAAWCEYPLRFGDGEVDPVCVEYRHYVRCTEHEYCHCTGDTLILVCERCWPALLNEIRRKAYDASELPERREIETLHSLARPSKRDNDIPPLQDVERRAPGR